MQEKCDKCSGRRIVQGMGGIKKKCTNCGGKGFVYEKKETKKQPKADI